jgi:hypothetical protein
MNWNHDDIEIKEIEIYDLKNGYVTRRFLKIRHNLYMPYTPCKSAALRLSEQMNAAMRIK